MMRSALAPAASRAAAALAVALGVISAFPVISAAQIESRVLDEKWPLLMLPPYVMELPPPTSAQLQAPLLFEKLAAETAPKSQADAAAALVGEEKKDGDPQATTLEQMMKAPREVIELAKAGKHAEAIEQGKPLLAQDRTTYGDFTWDLLTSAVACSQLQSGAYADAVASWRLGGSRIRDLAVREYHLIAARVVERYQKESPDELEKLKDYAALQAEVIKELKEPVRQILRSLELTKTIKAVDGRVKNLAVAYDKLRLVMAVDRDTGQKLVADYFRPAADTLITDTGPLLLNAGKQQHQLLVRSEEMPLKRSDIPAWNAEVVKLWNLIREAKRLARIHNYLQRLGLAGNADNRSLFEESHDLLFAPGELRQIWQTTGRSTSAGFDMNRRTASAETPSRTELREAEARERRGD